MKTSNLLFALLLTGSLFVFSCKEGAKDEPKPVDVQELTKDKPETHGTEMKEGDLTLTTPLD